MCARPTYCVLCSSSHQSRTSDTSSPSPPLIRRALKSSNSQFWPSALTLTLSAFILILTRTPHWSSTRPRKSTATCTTFAPLSMPVIDGSTRVTPSLSRQTPVRGQWANIHLATPLYPALSPTTPSISPLFLRCFCSRNLLRSLPIVIPIGQDGRDCTGLPMLVSRQSVSLLNRVHKPS